MPLEEPALLGWREWFAGSWGCLAPPHPLTLLELSRLDCWVSIVIETLLCGNLGGFSLSRNAGHLLWEPGRLKAFFSTGQTEVLRGLFAFSAWLGLTLPCSSDQAPFLCLCPSHFPFPTYSSCCGSPFFSQALPAGTGSLCCSPQTEGWLRAG